MPVELTWPIAQPSTPASPSGPTPTPPLLNNGNENLTEDEVIRRFLHPGIRGANTNALIAGLAAGDRVRNQVATAVYDQGFLVTASDIYLERKIAALGIKKPSKVGISDEDFRKLAITVDNNKLTYEAILETLEVYYGETLVKASATSDNDEPYSLLHDDELVILLNNKDNVIIKLEEDAFVDISEAQAIELATFINNKFIEFNIEAKALVTLNNSTSKNRITLISNKRGLGSSIQIIGGRAQTVLQFPESIFTDNGGSPNETWDISLSTETVGNLIFTTTNSVNYDFTQLLEGDIIYIYGDEFEDSGNIGAFPISNIQVYYDSGDLIQSFEIENILGDADSVSQLEYENLMFFRPIKNTLYTQQRRVVVSKDGNGLDIIIPATTQIVSRTPESGAYLKCAPILDISSITRVGSTVTVITSSAHELSSGDFIIVDNGLSSATSPSVTAGTPSGAYSSNTATGTTNGSIITSVSATNTVNKVRHKALTMLNDVIITVGGLVQQDVGGTPTVSDTKANVYYETSSSTLSDGSIQKGYTWKQKTNALSIGNYDFGISLLKDGRGLITGGYSGTNLISSPFTPIDLYDNISYDLGTDTLLQNSGSLPAAVAGHSQCSLGNGNAIISGGWSTQADWNLPISTARLFSASTNAWSSIASVNQARMNHESILLDNNKVLVVGGRVPFTRVGASEDSNDISYWALDTAPANVTPDLIGSNDITISAGVDAVSDRGRAGLSFLPGSPTDAHTTAGASQTALNTSLLDTWTVECWVMADATGVFLSNGTAGGGSANNCLVSFGITKYTSSNPNDGKFFWRWENGSHSEVINYSTILADTIFKTYESSNQGIWHHVALTKDTAASLAVNKYDVSLYVDGELVQTWIDQDNATGGSTGLFYLAIDPTKTTMTQLNTRIDEVRVSGIARSAAQIKANYNKQCGYTYFDTMDYWTDEYKVGTCLNSCEIYDPNANTWTNTGVMTYARAGFGLIKASDGRVFCIGGLGYDPTQSSTAVVLDSIEIYDPGNGKWISGPKMPVARAYPVCILLNNQIWVMGGRGVTQLDILDLDTLTWKTSITQQATAPYRAVGGTINNAIIVAGGSLPTTATNIYTAPHTSDITSRLGFITIPATESIKGAGINGIQKVTEIVNSTKFKYETEENSYFIMGSGAKLTKMAAPTATEDIPGPYIFDKNQGVPVTNIKTTLDQDLIKGQSYDIINVDDASEFPVDGGYIVFNFGYSNQVGPIKLIGKISDTQLKISSGDIINNYLPTGASITLLNGKVPFIPTETKGSFWLTPSAAGRIAAEESLQDVIAAGLDINIDVLYPSDKGLGNEGFPETGDKVSDIVKVFGGDN